MMEVAWGPQAALYLFLGGAGAALFLVSQVLLFCSPRRFRLVVWASGVVSWAMVLVGLLLLTSELLAPGRVLLFFQSFSNPTSWMARGAWIMGIALAVFGLAGLLAWPSVGESLARRSAWFNGHGMGLRRGIAAVGMGISLVAMTYTGLLLSDAGGVPAWDTPALPLLFVVSSFEGGLSLLEVIVFLLQHREVVGAFAKRLISRLSLLMPLVEAALLAWWLWDAGFALGEGMTSLLFWGAVVAVGIVVPVAVNGAAAIGGESPSEHAALVSAAAVLVGCVALRFVVLGAGVHGDPVGAAMAPLLL